LLYRKRFKNGENSKKAKDAHELEVEYKAGTWAAVAMLILACVYYYL